MNNKPLLTITLLSTLLLSACGGSSSSPSAESGNSSDISNDSINIANNDDVVDLDAESGCEPDEAEAEMLSQINAARAQNRSCGGDDFQATAPLKWNCSLEQAAFAHSSDMEENNFFSHTGSDGLSASARVNATDYTWMAVGENIAAGQTSISKVMQGWLNSPGHCRNIMEPRYKEVGTSLVNSSTADYPTYWTQVFATPR